MFLRALCINVARLGVSCGGSLRPLLAAWNIDLVALSEADVTCDSGPSWVREWKSSSFVLVLLLILKILHDLNIL